MGFFIIFLILNFGSVFWEMYIRSPFAVLTGTALGIMRTAAFQGLKCSFENLTYNQFGWGAVVSIRKKICNYGCIKLLCQLFLCNQNWHQRFCNSSLASTIALCFKLSMLCLISCSLLRCNSVLLANWLILILFTVNI